MAVLMWEKPKRVMSKETWTSIQADGAPPGTYCSNMSPEDQMRWKAKLVGVTLGFPQVEIRRNGLVVIVSSRGYKYNGYDCRQTEKNPGADDRNVVHLASSGSQSFTLEELEEFISAIREAQAKLKELEACK